MNRKDRNADHHARYQGQQVLAAALIRQLKEALKHDAREADKSTRYGYHLGDMDDLNKKLAELTMRMAPSGSRAKVLYSEDEAAGLEMLQREALAKP